MVAERTGKKIRKRIEGGGGGGTSEWTIQHILKMESFSVVVSDEGDGDGVYVKSPG